MEREYGDNDPKLVPSLEQVARVLEAASKYPDAEKFLARAIAIREKASGPDSAELTPDLSQLARVDVAKHNLPAAEGLYDRVLKIQLARFSPNSPELLPTLDALAALSLEQKKDAEPLLKQTLSIREGNLGPNHVEVARNLDQAGGHLYRTEALRGGAKVKRAGAVHLDERTETGERGAGRKV